MRVTGWSLFLFLPWAIQGWGQTVPFVAQNWEIDPGSSEIVDYLGRKALRLKGGTALVKDAVFSDGVIELDIAFSGERGFMGAVWHYRNSEHYELFYLRPHQSGNPDANQYTPVFHGMWAWQLYHGEGFGAPVTYPLNQWIPVKIAVSGNSAEIYINNTDQPAVFVPELKLPAKEGKIGITAANYAPAYFSNFQYRSGAPVLKNRDKAIPGESNRKPTRMIEQWQVSNVFDEKALRGKVLLQPSDKDGLRWEPLDCDSKGIANLSRLRAIGKDADTVYARVTVVSGGDRVVRFQFGYSDRVKVFFNDRLCYDGDNGYRTRDYRYLGTIGMFDALALPLKKGENELWLAVSESFGGWGLQATFENWEGLTLKP